MSSKQIFDHPEILEESLVNLTEATKLFPVKCSRASLERWIRRGSRGVYLETVFIANKRFTSLEAIQRFLINQQNTEPERIQSAPKHRSMSQKEIDAKSREFRLSEPLGPSQN
jgi:Protein of unknown function (DUF1580).